MEVVPLCAAADAGRSTALADMATKAPMKVGAGNRSNLSRGSEARRDSATPPRTMPLLLLLLLLLLMLMLLMLMLMREGRRRGR